MMVYELIVEMGPDLPRAEYTFDPQLIIDQPGFDPGTF